ncbi:MAG: HAMP domain-containing histidine kinase, partial [Rhizobium sp.]
MRRTWGWCTDVAGKAESPLRAMSADPRILLECVRTLYLQIPNSFVAALVVSTYMVVTTWKQVPEDRVLLWLGLQGIAQVHRFWIYFGYRKTTLTTANARVWARRYAWYMAGAGFVWGSTAFLFFSVENPLTLALTMCGLYGISGGAVPGNAYFPPAIYAFTWMIFGMVMVKMAIIGDVGHVALGVASVFYALILTMFCRVQFRTLVEGFLIRFENAELVEKLQLQKQYAEDAKARAEQASLAKSQFLAAASHDLRQPLHALSLFSASLQELRLDRAAREIVERIMSSIGALESLFNALLDVSKLDAGVIKCVPMPVSVQQVFDRVRQYSESDADSRRISLTFMRTRQVVQADPILLERILSNLVSNAIRYTPSGGVLVGCRRAPAGRLRFEVWDSGVGIVAADHERIFEEFVQIGNPERDRRKGLG